VGAAAAVPKPRSDAEVSLQAGSESLDHQMAAANVSEKQLKQSSEPAFQKAVDAKSAAQADAAKAPQAFRQGEKSTLGQAQAEAKDTAQKDLQALHGGRAQALGKVAGHEGETKAQDEQARTQVSLKIQKIYDDAKDQTKKRLDKLDADVDAAFEKGATEAHKAFDDEVADKMFHYKLARYTGPAGPLLLLKDLILPLPDEVNVFYEQARQNYIQRMTAVLNAIATIVETGLTEAKAIVAGGRKSIDDYLNGLPEALQAVGREAAQGIQAKFDDLEHSVDEKQNSLIDSLAQKYTAKLQEIDDKIVAMKKANAGLIDAAKDAIGGVIDTIVGLKNMLTNVLAKASTAIDLIVADPIGFLGNLVAAVKKGFLGFVGKIGVYLEQGLMGWLFGALTEAGIELPKSFDLKSILGLILQILGLTYANIRSRAVKILGEKVVSTLETAAEIFQTLLTEGPAGLWKWIKEKVSALKDSVIGSIKDFVETKVITAGVTWIISLLNPASAFIKACKAIYDVVMFFVERGAQIMALVNAILDSVISIAKGNIAGAAAYVESVLAKSVPVVISFLASVLGLGGISEKIKSVIEKIREPINAAIDWVINLAVSAVKAAGKLLGFGAKEDPEKQNLPGVKGLAREELKQELMRIEGPEDIPKLTAEVRERLRPQGLKSLEAIEVNEESGFRFMAEASEKEDILKLFPADAVVRLYAKITFEKAITVSQKGTDRPEPVEFQKHSVTGEPLPLALPPVTVEDANIPKTYRMGRPKDRPATTPSGGAILPFEGKTDVVKVVTYNTKNYQKDDNPSHAESQLIAFLDSLSWGTISSVSRLEIQIDRSPCSLCIASLSFIRKYKEGLNKLADTDFVIIYNNLHKDKKYKNVNQFISTVKDSGWKVEKYDAEKHPDFIFK